MVLSGTMDSESCILSPGFPEGFSATVLVSFLPLGLGFRVQGLGFRV